jgi:DNA-binding SARP family transcriptional activator
VYLHLADAEPDHHAAVALLHTAVQFAPHNEALYQALMHRIAATGDRDGVYRLLAALTERLADHHTAPAAATVQLVTDLTHPAADPVASDRGAGR